MHTNNKSAIDNERGRKKEEKGSFHKQKVVQLQRLQILSMNRFDQGGIYILLEAKNVGMFLEDLIAVNAWSVFTTYLVGRWSAVALQGSELNV